HRLDRETGRDRSRGPRLRSRAGRDDDVPRPGPEGAQGEGTASSVRPDGHSPTGNARGRRRGRNTGHRPRRDGSAAPRGGSGRTQADERRGVGAWSPIHGRRTDRMSPSARAIALEVVRRVADEGAYSTRALPAALERSGLDERDRALATELTYGTLRHLPSLDAAIGRDAARPI